MPLTTKIEAPEIEAEPTLDSILAPWLAELRPPRAARFGSALNTRSSNWTSRFLDDADYRSWETMEEYRQWCEDNLPEWLGYSRK